MFFYVILRTGGERREFVTKEVFGYSDGFWTSKGPSWKRTRDEKVDLICYSCGARCDTKVYGRWTYVYCPNNCKGIEDFIPTGYYLRAPETMPNAFGKKETPFGKKLKYHQRRLHSRGLENVPDGILEILDWGF